MLRVMLHFVLRLVWCLVRSMCGVVWRAEKPPCVRPNRARVCIVYVPGTTRTCSNTCARGAGTHGDVLNVHTGCRNPHTGFTTFFPARRTTPHQTRTPKNTHTPQPPTTHTTQLNITQRQRQRDREKTAKDKERRQRKKDGRGETRQKNKNKRRQDKTKEKRISREEKREEKKRE